MNYSEICARMPWELRSRIQAETVYAPWLGQGYGLEDIWADPVVLETIFNRMGPDERTVLEGIVRDIGSELFDAARLEKSARGLLSGAEMKAGLAGLLRKGFIFAFRKTWGELVYLLPEDSFGLWQQIMFPELAVVPPDGTALSGIEPIQAVKTDIRRGLFQALVFAAQQELKLTQNGILHKKQLQKWLELIPLNETLLQGTTIKYAYADAYPMKAAIMLDMLLRLQLIVPDGETLKLQSKALKTWLNRSVNEQHLVLYSIWKRLTLPAEAWLQHAVSLLERSDHGHWFSPLGLLTGLERQGLMPAPAESGLEERLGRLQQKWLDPLAAMGWLEKGTEALGGRVHYRWCVRLFQASRTPQESEEPGRFMVQPDFEIIVPPDVTDEVCWELCCIADPVAHDQVSVYKLSKASIRRALENGRTAEEMAEFLEAHALYGVPDHLLPAIEGWARPFGKLTFANTLLLRCDDEETASTVAKLPGAAPYIQEAVGTKDYIIALDDLQPLAAVLEKAGYMPGMPLLLNGKNGSGRGRSYPKLADVNPQEDEADAEFQLSMDRGLIYSRNSAHYLQLESQLPEPADLYPDLKDIPPMWLKDYRTYHVSTRKEIVEKAIEMKTLLQVRMNGTDYRVAPRKVQDTRGTWWMTGIEQRKDRLPQALEVRWHAGEWDEMKLILPGINDKY
ncbi:MULTISPECIES: helicase-associated domain-containing protein [unclassified Paenibacillus]|uniref:helicase-associated domain-containing protein n=1 Tax=unclassified Paenibacillus TaxID=185978 RepID=UPI0021198214|nr:MULTISPECIES: helicase-associated domain-containing protein [unclassified Paenibacillus]